MKQILQNLKTGTVEVAEIPVPNVKRGQLLIKTSHTLISAGTERMLVEFGKAGWIEKAIQQPDKVRMVVDKIKTDGIQPTIEAIFNKLDKPLPVGYCNVGRIAAIGAGVVGFELHQRVISNGKHAEVVSVPVNLCAKVPDSVSDEEAAFTVLGAVALQGIRLVQPTLGETVVVTGLGLIGLMTVQLLRAHGCRVLGLDFNKERLKLARLFGAEVIDLTEVDDPIRLAQSYSRGRGVDAVIVTASTKSNEPMRQAASMCRKRGRIVLVGVTGLELSRDDFFKKELTFQVSASYGPGRYDPDYEDRGHDYPAAFVRWTEQRNFEAVLDMMADGRLDVRTLISHRFSIAEAEKAYELVGAVSSSLGILLVYPGLEIAPKSRAVLLEPYLNNLSFKNVLTKAPVSFVGAGNYATAVLIPAFKEAGANLRIVASSTGVSSVYAGRKYGFCEATSDINRIIFDDVTRAIVIATRHDSHADFVLKALRGGKHVFVEKPLCLTYSELLEIEAAYSEIRRHSLSPPIVMVGFNRRFAPQVQRIKQLLKGVMEPKSFIMTINAGTIPADHWTHDLESGGGRIIGEACHFIDLLRFLVGVPLTSWQLLRMDAPTQDTVSIQLGFADGSIGAVHYFANGNKSLPKERLEVFASGRVLQLDNYRKLTGFGWSNFSKMNLWRQDKGQKACVKAFVEAINGREAAPIPFDEILEVSRVSIELAEVVN